MTTVADKNRFFYDALYRRRSPLSHLLHARVSFDQRSKSRLNWALLRPVLARLARRDGAASPVRILDYGAGWGTFLLDAPAGLYAYAYDISETAVENLASTMRLLRRPFAPARVGEGGAITPRNFDVVVCSHVLEHVEDEARLLRELASALRPGGFLLVNVPINELVADPKHARAYDRASLEAALARAGLGVVEAVEADRWSALIIDRESAATSKRARAALRGLRGLLAVLPHPVTVGLERLVPARYPRQQLLALAQKAG